MNNTSKINFLGLFLFITIIFSYIFSEDTLGAAKHDYLFHEKFIILFADDFINTFNSYGQEELYARNSPIFYMLLSCLYRMGIDLESIRYLNIISAPLIGFLFYECLKIQFSKSNLTILKFLTLVIFLSPTIRSLIIWPYPILYALIFFLLSVKFYLEFSKNKNNKILNALKSTFFLAASAYITPNFSVFAIYFIYKFYIQLKNSNHLKYILIFNLLLALPALTYYYTFDFYLIKYPGLNLSDSITFNIFNRIIIISSLVFFYFLPFITKNSIQNLVDEIRNLKKNYIIYVFIFICIFFFNFTPEFGGGIFYKISNKLFLNNLLLYFVFFISIMIFKSSGIINFNNILIFVCLIIYNSQIEIYHKYFDPLLLFIFLFLSMFKKGEIKINLKEISKKYYYLYIFFLALSLSDLKSILPPLQ